MQTYACAAAGLLAAACSFSPVGEAGPAGAGPDGGEDRSEPDGGAIAPEFAANVQAVPPDVRDEMIGRSWHADLGCPAIDSLALVTLSHWGFDGAIHTGELVVAASAADDVVAAFRVLFDEQFPIERIERVDAYGGDDDASMAANNTSAFNCREVTGGGALSQHSYGTAIDMNPVQNPYVYGSTILPEAGGAYLDRSRHRTGMIARPGPALRAFTAIGWDWGGDWDEPVDYQHFEAP